VAAEPVSLRRELLEAPNPLIRQSEHHDSGWGMAVYERVEGADPALIRIPEAAHAGRDFARATEATGRIFNVHVRRATVGGLALENTHPFTLGSLSFGHNGTVIDYPLLEIEDVAGDTDSSICSATWSPTSSPRTPWARCAGWSRPLPRPRCSRG